MNLLLTTTLIEDKLTAFDALKVGLTCKLLLASDVARSSILIR